MDAIHDLERKLEESTRQLEETSRDLATEKGVTSGLKDAVNEQQLLIKELQRENVAQEVCNLKTLYRVKAKDMTV